MSLIVFFQLYILLLKWLITTHYVKVPFAYRCLIVPKYKFNFKLKSKQKTKIMCYQLQCQSKQQAQLLYVGHFIQYTLIYLAFIQLANIQPNNIITYNINFHKQHQIHPMEANCLVFPSPQKYNVQPVIYKIVLVPQNQDQHHIYYHNYLNLCSYSGDDDFQNTISRINKDQIKNLSRISKEQSSMRNNLSNQKSIQKSFVPQRIQTSHQEKIQFFQRKSGQEKNTRNSVNNTKMQTNLQKTKVDPKQYIPCLFLPGRKDKIIVFFHANAQDITSAGQFLKMICYETQYSILAIQYRGYSIFGGQTNPDAINRDSQRVIQYLLGRKILTDQLIIFGRSIGCAVALSVVNQAKFYCVVLLSPFLSLKKIAKQLYGNCAGWALKQGFNNQQSLLNINSPLLLIHGLKDTLVPYQHSLALLSQCKAYCQAKIIQSMTHSRFNFREDFIKHFKLFLLQLDQ